MVTDNKIIVDHTGKEVTHGRETVNGVRLHYLLAGSGTPVVLLHGVPKTSFYYYKLIPLLSQKYTVLVPDLRGFGDSARPDTGYDMKTVAEDIAQLTTRLGMDEFYLHGEDWGAAFAYALTADNPTRVKKLSYAEMLLPGFGLEDWGHLTAENVNSGHWLWHISFFHLREYPEFLIQGRERQFWSTWMKNECYNPAGVNDAVVDEVVRCSSQPGGLRSIFEVYRATFKNIADDEAWATQKLTMPVMATGSRHFIGDEVRLQMERVAIDVTPRVMECGHSLSLELPDVLAKNLIEFFGD